MSIPVADYLAKLHCASQEENWLLAAYYAAEVLQVEPRDPIAWRALARAAVGLGRRKAAERFLQQIRATGAGQSGRDDELDELTRRVNEIREPAPHAGPRYLVVREWGAGFWADVEHVIAQLLVAEATARTPVVFWGSTSKFYPRGFSGNAWEEYFEPVSAVPMGQVVQEAAGLTIAPRKWDAGNLEGPVFNRWNGEGARFSAILALGCPENIVVADFHTSSFVIGMWVPPSLPMLKLPYQQLLRRYLRPRPAILERVAGIRRSWGEGPVIALHLRGTDKPAEQPRIVEANEALTHDALRRLDATGARLFLLTDSASLRAGLAAQLGPRLITTDAIRSDGVEGLHLSGQHDPRRLALDVMVDTYLAAGCDEFFGCTASNVACMVARLWSDRATGLNLYGGFPNHAKPNAYAMTAERDES